LLSNIVFAENTLGTLLTHRTDNQRASMSAIDLNVANLQEQVSSLPSALLHNYAVSQDVVDLTLVSTALLDLLINNNR